MKIVGHRGARGLAPENTITSLKEALKYKVDEIEIDVRVTKDNVVILNHDPFIRGHMDHEYWISHHTYQELKQQKSDLSTFDEAIRVVNKAVPLMVDVKPNERTDPIVTVIKKHLDSGWQSSDFLVGSFDQQTLKQVHSLLPEVQEVIIDRWSGIRAAHRAKELNTRLLSMNYKFLWFGFISAMNRQGFELYAYPLNDPKKAKSWVKYGLKGVITDYPNRFKS